MSKFTFPIRLKIIASTFFGLSLIAIFLIGLSYYGGRKQISSAYDKKDKGTAEMVAMGVGIGLNTGQFNVINEALEWAKADSALVYIVVYDEHLRILSEYNPHQVNLDPKLVLDPSTEQTFRSYHVRRTITPVEFSGEHYGMLVYCSSLEVVETATSEYISMAIKVCLVIFCLGILVSIFMSDKITRPLRQLTIAATEMSAGKRVAVMPVESDDEVGQLSKAFNEMVKNIDATMNQLQGVNEQLQTSIRRMPLAYILTDINMNILIWNRSAEKMFGQKEEKVKGQELLQLVTTKASYPILNQAFRSLIDEDTVPGTIEIQSLRADKIVIYCNWHQTLLKDNDGTVIGILSMVENVTKRRESERALTESLQTSNDLVHSIPSALVIFQYEIPDRLILVNSNKLAERLTKFRFNECKTKEFDDFGLNTEHNLKNQLLDVMRTGKTLKREDLKHTWKRRTTIFRLLAFSMPNNRLGVAFEDITELTVARNQKKELQEKLERAERLESLGVLAGGVAHDLNNILGPLVGYPELLLEKLAPESTERKHVKRIYESALQAADIVQDLLALARRGKYNMQLTSINKVVQTFMETATVSKQMHTHPEIPVNLDLDNNLPVIMGSAPHLSKTFMNIVVNAFDAMEGAGTLTISTHSEVCIRNIDQQGNMPAGDYVVLKIKDTGPGIEKEDLGKIFEPYFSKKPMGRSGSGLGLAVVHGVVKDHKGFIEINTKVGVGTEFVIRFPASVEKNVPVQVKYNEVRGNEKILIVDDSQEQRQMATVLLNSLGYHVDAVHDGHQALTFLENNQPDLVLLDMIMEPDFDGLDTYEGILEIQPDIKVIIVSGFSSTERVEKMQQQGAGRYIKKPYTRKSLGEAIRAELDKTSLPVPV